MDFNSFCKADGGVHNNDVNSCKLSQNNDIKDIENAINKYGNMTENEVLNTLYEEVRRERKEGVFDIASLRQFYRNISPFLKSQERIKMRGIIEEIERS